MEGLEHIEGILNRDQRTAKLKFKCDTEVTEEEICFSGRQCNNASIIRFSRTHCKCPNRTKAKSYLMWRRRYFNKYQSLKKVLLASVCLSLLRLPVMSCAPTNIKMSSDLKNDSEKWINPCGLPNTTGTSEDAQPQLTTRELISAVLTTTRVALEDATEFLEIFAKERFDMNHSALHALLASQSSEWLHRLPKSLNESVPEEHLKSLELHKLLLDVYGYLQKIAVGLEQMKWDERDKMDVIFQRAQAAEYKLRGVLCEIQMALYDRNVPIRHNVTREEMSPEERKGDHTKRKTRDWIILREYVNALEYVNQVFEYLLNTL